MYIFYKIKPLLFSFLLCFHNTLSFNLVGWSAHTGECKFLVLGLPSLAWYDQDQKKRACLCFFSLSGKQAKILGREWMSSRTLASLLGKIYLLIETTGRKEKVREKVSKRIMELVNALLCQNSLIIWKILPRKSSMIVFVLINMLKSHFPP